MASNDRVHDRELLDALESFEPIGVQKVVWRVARTEREPCRGSVADGRWGKAHENEVLYTSTLSEGALAEIGYRLGLEPLWPSRLSHDLHEIEITLDRVLSLSTLDQLHPLGVDVTRYEGHYYSIEQAISAAARFLGYSGLIVPNARHSSENIVIYSDALSDGCSVTLVSSSPVDWNLWRAMNRSRPSRSK